MIKTITLVEGNNRRTIYEVTLREIELLLGEYAGKLRTLDSRDRRLQGRAGIDNIAEGPERDRVGAIGEYVASIATHRPWTAFTDYKAPDLDGWIEVRTRSKSNGELKVKSDDPDDMPVVLVTGTDDRLVWLVQGWMWARDAKDPSWYDDPTNSGKQKEYFVPQRLLHSITTLPERAPFRIP